LKIGVNWKDLTLISHNKVGFKFCDIFVNELRQYNHSASIASSYCTIDIMYCI